MEMEPVTVIGSEYQSGAYVLRLVFNGPVAVRFGRFQGGAALDLPAGEALYVGSAMGPRGSTTLARRLLRHATRSGTAVAHDLRAPMLAAFSAAGLGPPDLQAPAQKRPSWHIDYLLDEPQVALRQVFVLRSPSRLETRIADMLAADAATYVFSPGLGAQDRKGAAHVLGVRAPEAWWLGLSARLAALSDG